MAGHVNKHNIDNFSKSTVRFICNICGEYLGKKCSLMTHFSRTLTDKEKKIYKEQQNLHHSTKNTSMPVGVKQLQDQQDMVNISLP